MWPRAHGLWAGPRLRVRPHLDMHSARHELHLAFDTAARSSLRPFSPFPFLAFPPSPALEEFLLALELLLGILFSPLSYSLPAGCVSQGVWNDVKSGADFGRFPFYGRSVCGVQEV